jgi:hypothetical protein
MLTPGQAAQAALKAMDQGTLYALTDPRDAPRARARIDRLLADLPPVATES